MQTFREAILRATDAFDISLRKLADEAGGSYEQLKKVRQGKSASTNVDDANRVAGALGITLDQLLSGEYERPPSIEIAGAVGAGAQVPVFEAYEKGTGPRVEVPSGIPTSGIVAVEVQGDSMTPVYAPGEILLYTRVTEEGAPDDAIGRICVIEDENGHGWVKQLRNGSEPGLFHLVSINPGAETMHNRKVKWAARVRFNLPPEAVRKL